MKIKTIIGPTAVGKSAYAMEWCKKHNGEIVCADSMQVYRHMDIGTAKPTKIEQEQVRHHCVDIVEPNEHFSVGQWVELADKAIDDIVSRGKTPVICGGTGLYIKSLLFKHSFVESDLCLRKTLQTQLEEKGKQYMYDMLAKIDCKTASKLSLNDTKRVLRALEIYYITGMPKSQNESVEDNPRYQSHTQIINMDRDKLYSRIDSRVERMIQDGFVQEVESLMKYKHCQSMNSLGYKELSIFLQGDISKEDCINLIKKNTRNYAKRQLTYFRHQIPNGVLLEYEK